MKPLLLITCLIILAGCNIDKILHSPKHDTKKLDKIHGRNPNVVNKGCLIWYPFVPIDSTSTVIVKSGNDTSDWIVSSEDWLKGLPDWSYHGEPMSGIELPYTGNNIQGIVYKQRTITSHDTVYKTRTITVSDTRLLGIQKAKADSLGAVVITLDKSVSRAKTQRNLFMWLFFGSIAAAGALLYFKPKMLFK